MSSIIWVTDHAARRVQVKTPACRIVSLAPSNTEIIYALGAQESLYGVTEYCDYPEEAKLKPKVGGYSTVDINLIRKAEPDLVFAGAIHLRNALAELEKLSCPVLILEGSTVMGMLQAMQIAGRCIGKERTASSLVESLRARADAITSKTAQMSMGERPRVFYLHECQTWKTFGAETIGDTLTELAGGYNIGRDFGNYYPYPTLDDIVKSDPEVIIAETGYGVEPMEPLRLALVEPSLEKTKARKSGRVYGVSSDLISRAGPRMIGGLEKLASLFHPELFEPDSRVNEKTDG